MHRLQALCAAALCGIAFVVGTWLTPKEGPRSARLTAYALVAAAFTALVLVVLVRGLPGIVGNGPHRCNPFRGCFHPSKRKKPKP